MGGKSEYDASSLKLVGPNGPQAFQLSDVEYWPSTTFIRSGCVSFVAGPLAAYGEQKYILGPRKGDGSVPAPSTDLNIASNETEATLSTSVLGIKVRLGSQIYSSPVPPEQVPGPVLSLRLPDGTWFGRSRLYGSTPISGWSACVSDAGPVFARYVASYSYADGRVLQIRISLNAGDYAACFDCTVRALSCRPSADSQDAGSSDGWELVLGNGIALPEGVKIQGMRYLAKEVPFRVDPGSADPLFYLTPWAGDGWFADSPTVVRLKTQGRESEIHLSARRPGEWVEPRREAPWFNFTRWSFEMIDVMWSGWRGLRIPAVPADDGVALRLNSIAGRRIWTVGFKPNGDGLLDAFLCRGAGHYTPLPTTLDELKDMTLEWPDGVKHPSMFASAEELKSMAERNPAAWRDMSNVAPLTNNLSNLGALDYMRVIMDTAVRYDAHIDSGVFTAEERTRVKARMALLAHLVADPTHWSFERGFCSGNPNMTVSRYANISFLGFALWDHPMGRQWASFGVEWMKRWLREVVDDSGSWPESAHYARVSWADFVDVAILARNRGMHDFFSDPKFRKMALFYEKTMMPPHPLRLNGAPPAPARVTALYGRGTRMDAWGGMASALAAVSAGNDPAFSRVMQWCWKETGWSEMFSHSTAGMTALLADRSLPAEAPSWESERLPTLGYLLRSGVGTPVESYLLFVTEYMRSPDGEIWPPDTGSIAGWYALGKPLGGAFSRAPETAHSVTVNRVLPAVNWDPASGASVQGAGFVTSSRHDGAAFLPGADYANVLFDVWSNRDFWLSIPKEMPGLPKRQREGRTPYKWRRQLWRVDGTRGDGPSYLALRDTVSGGEPTQWHFWTWSEKIGTPEEAAARESFLADKPGAKTAQCRELKGNRFTAVGQFGVDVEYYIAAPTDTPRHTLRFGVSQGAYGVARAIPEYQDLLCLQREDDGEYFVVLCAREQGAAAPQFETCAEGRGVRISGDFGSDILFVCQERSAGKVGSYQFEAEALVIQERAGSLRLLFGSPGHFASERLSIRTPVPAEAEISDGKILVFARPGDDQARIEIEHAGSWTLGKESDKGVKWLPAHERGGTLCLPPGTAKAVLTKRR